MDQLKNVVEKKVDGKRQLIRKPLVQQPLLDGIPEVPFSLKNRHEFRREKKTNKYQNFQEPTIVEEPSLNENSHKLDHDVDSNSQGSGDQRSTPRNLSTEDLSSERDDEVRSPSSEKKSGEWSAEATPSSSSTNNTNTTKFNYPSPQPSRSLNDANRIGSSAMESALDVLSGGEDVTTNGGDTQPSAIPTINTPDAVAPATPGDIKPAETKVKTPKTVSVIVNYDLLLFNLVELRLFPSYS